LYEAVAVPIFSCSGGDVLLPDRRLLLADREDGGNLVVNPPRPVWERSELTPEELTRWAFLVAAAGRAMLDVLPQLAGGCINYWEAGNWALNDEAEPRGPKTAAEHRRMHLHLIGRSPRAKRPTHRWGEAPEFPKFEERFTWGAGFERFTPEECRGIVERIEELLTSRYGMPAEEIAPRGICGKCGYPVPR
jgi:hypothetical protein